MTAFPVSDVIRQKNVFSPLTLSHSKRHGGGCSEFLQGYFHNSDCACDVGVLRKLCWKGEPLRV